MVLFIVTTFWSYGELIIALEFAQTLYNEGITPLFFIPISHEKILKEKGFMYWKLIPKGRNLNCVIMKEIQACYAPEYVILADYINYAFCEKHYGITIDDLSIFSGKIGILDLYDIENTKRSLDAFGQKKNNFEKLSISNFDKILQPCPFLPFEKKKSVNMKYRYKLFNHIESRNQNDKKLARKHIGISDKKSIVLMTSAVWQYISYQSHYVKNFILACASSMEKIISSHSNEILFFHIGNRSFFTSVKYTNYIHFDTMPPSEFNQLVNAADMYISNNYISTSMLKIALSGIPTLLLCSSYIKNDTTNLWLRRRDKEEPEVLKNCRYAYPFRLFPVGWFKFLSPIVTNNSFFSLVEEEEMLDHQAVVDKMRCMLFNQCDHRENNRLGYIARLNQLPSAIDVLF